MKTIKIFKTFVIICTLALAACNNSIHWKNYNNCIKYTTDKSTFENISQKIYKGQVNFVGTLDSLGEIIPSKDSLQFNTIISLQDKSHFAHFGLDTFIKSDNFPKPMLVCIEYSCEFLRDLNPTIEIPLNDSSSKKSIDVLTEKIKSMPFVRNIKYVSKDSSAGHLEKELGEDFVKTLGQNPIPNMLKIYFLSSITENDIDNLENILEKDATAKEFDLKDLRLIPAMTEKNSDKELVFLIKK